MTLLPSDLTVALWRDGYDAVPRQRARSGTADGHAFETRLLGRRALVVGGEEGARLFYDQSLVRRRDAVPAALSNLLFGHGAVHGLDGDEHRERKDMFLRILRPEEVDRFAGTAAARLDAAVAGWSPDREVVLFDELVQVYGHTVLEWAGTGCEGEEASAVSRDLAAIVDGFGGAGAAYPRAWAARRRVDRWAAEVLRQVDDGRLATPPGSAVDVVARSGLDRKVAAVELGNVVRPTVAVAWLGAFVALALVQHPEHGEVLLHGTDEQRTHFADEVRRLYPFVPVLAGRLERDVSWHDHEMRAGDAIVLDVRGSNLDGCTWSQPEGFVPERYHTNPPNEFQLLPQGGGYREAGHRCPGEPLTIALLAETARRLAALPFTVRSTHYDASRIPTRPDDGVRLRVTAPTPDV
jgi:fatty-acid peroxygenase